ncbi:hypothetical protein F2Q69_00036393 [Brassica cretica]|uniref:Retrotransposon gag domain-containing protein n=1 Tax=Brassica cretica TaxID=69181 RepID=A0A8S9SVW6_BRACR|nr:hypothetical protein F2Q69_00036393 [Brassica cretica]
MTLHVFHRGTVHLDTVHSSSIDTVHPASIDTVHLASIDTVHLASIDTAHPDTVHRDTVHPDTVHPGTVHPLTVHSVLFIIDTVKNDTTCWETEKIEVLIIEGAVIHDVIDVVEMNDFDLSREWYDWVGQDPFQGLPHQDPKNHIEDFEDLVSKSEQNEVSEFHMPSKIFPYFISGDAFSWFSQLQPGSLTSWEDIERAFLYKFLDDAEATREKEKNDKWDMLVESWQIKREDQIPIQLLSYIMDIADSTHKSVDISSCDPTSDGDKEITIEDFLELEEFLELEDEEKLVDLDSTREVTMEDFLELEEWLEDMDHNSKKKLDDDQHTSRGDLETSKANIDRHQPYEIDRQPTHIIDLRPSYIIDRHLANSINLHPPDIDLHRQPIIDRHHPPNIDRCPLVDVPPGYIVELEPVEERVHESEASRNADSKYLRPLICAEEAAEFHKRVNRIHDLVKIVVPCDVFAAESPITPDRSVHLDSYSGILDDHQHVEASQRGLRFRDECDKDPAEATSVDTDRSEKSGGKKRRNWKKRKRIMGDSQLSLIPHFSDGVRKFIVHSRCFSQPFAKLRALLIAEMIDKGEESMEEAYTQE